MTYGEEKWGLENTTSTPTWTQLEELGFYENKTTSGRARGEKQIESKIRDGWMCLERLERGEHDLLQQMNPKSKFRTAVCDGELSI